MKMSKGQSELDRERKQRKTRSSFRSCSEPVHRTTLVNVIISQTPNWKVNGAASMNMVSGNQVTQHTSS